MKTSKILFLITLTTASSFAEEVTEIIPGSSTDLAVIESYEPPYKQGGIFINSKRLASSISSAEAPPESLAHLIALSNEHYDALNNRDLKTATAKASEMKEIWSGKYGFQEVKVSLEQSKTLQKIKFRSVEQIEMSLPKTETFADAHNEEQKAAFDLARNLTNTPLFFQNVSYGFSKLHGVKENSYLIIPQLEKINVACEKILSDCVARYPTQESNIRQLYSLKKEAYMEYLGDVYKTLDSEKMRNYRAVDRGQTSAGHHNTCLFNSVFYTDQTKGNIPSTKIGSIQKAKDYLTFIRTLYTPYSSFLVDNPLYDSGHISKKLSFLEGNRSIEAHYGIEAVVQDGRFFPGVLADCSALEIQAHSLSANYIVFLKSKTIGKGDNLLSYYGFGYLGSENFPIIPVSSSTGHAQGLVAI